MAATRQPVVTDLWKTARSPSRAGRIHNCGELVHERFERHCLAQKKNISEQSHANFSGSSPRRRKPAKHSRWQPTSTIHGCAKKFEQNDWRLTFAAANERRLLALSRLHPAFQGEFTVAKDQYVRLNTGWFSDRSACYLACRPPSHHAGKPASPKIYGGKEGLLSFRTVDEVADGVKRINCRLQNTLSRRTRGCARSLRS